MLTLSRPSQRLNLANTLAALHGLIGVLIALHERRTSGRGQVVDVALSEAVFSMLEGILPEYGYLGAKWLFDKLGGQGNVVYMRGAASTVDDSLRLLSMLSE